MTVLATSPRTAPAEAAGAHPSMVERMTLIMDSFEGRGTRLTLEDVTRRTHLPRSTAHRILDQLVRLRWLEHTSAGYGLGSRALGLGGRDGGHGELRAAAAPLLHELQVKTGIIVHLAVLDCAEVYYLDKIGGRLAVSVPSQVGGRVPAHATALGKSMLAWLQPEQVDARIGATMSRLTSGTIGDIGVLHQELRRIRQRHGLAFERGECFPNIACAAVAVRGPEGPVASISVVGDLNIPLEKVAPLVVDAARRTSVALFPGPDKPRRAHRDRAAPDGTWSAETMARLLAAGQTGDWL